MAIDVGKVVFDDGTTMYAVVDGSVGLVYRTLFSDAETAFSARDNYQPATVPEHVPDEEPVAVWEWHLGDSERPSFYSRASRSLKLLSGPTSRNQANGDYVNSISWS